MGRGAESDRDGLPNSFEGEVHVPLNSGEVGRTTMPISDKHIYIYANICKHASHSNSDNREDLA